MPSNRNKQINFGLALIGLLILVAIAYYAISEGYFQFPSAGTGTGRTGTSDSGKIGVGVTIEFTDGSTKTVDPSQIQYTLFPLTVYFQGQAVKSITWHTYVLLDWQGDLTSLELKGPMTLKSDTGVTLRNEGMLKSYSAGSLPTKNQWFEMWKFTLDAADIEYSLPKTGDYTLTCLANVTATAMFSTGLQSVKTASTSSNLPITIQLSGLTVLSVDIQAQIFT
jgi:hypothetical protein